jgi:acyl-CoA synthetase (AMP-forming)/AMP-acid ligase II
MIARGIAPQDRVGVPLNDGLRSIPFEIGCLKARVTRVPLNSRLSAAEQARMPQSTDARALVYGPDLEERAAQLREALGGGPATSSSALPATAIRTCLRSRATPRRMIRCRRSRSTVPWDDRRDRNSRSRCRPRTGRSAAARGTRTCSAVAPYTRGCRGDSPNRRGAANRSGDGASQAFQPPPTGSCALTIG